MQKVAISVCACSQFSGIIRCGLEEYETGQHGPHSKSLTPKEKRGEAGELAA